MLFKVTFRKERCWKSLDLAAWTWNFFSFYLSFLSFFFFENTDANRLRQDVNSFLQKGRVTCLTMSCRACTAALPTCWHPAIPHPPDPPPSSVLNLLSFTAEALVHPPCILHGLRGLSGFLGNIYIYISISRSQTLASICIATYFKHDIPW